MGTMIPNMGTLTKSPSRLSGHGLAAALFTTTQQRVLGILFGQPSRSFYAKELISLSAGGGGAILRELKRLADAELITVRKIGNQKHYQANQASPIFDSLVDIIVKTVGLAEPIKNALQRIANQIKAAFIYGSIAKKSDTSRSDIDLMIISDTLGYADLFAAVESAVALVGRSINPTVYTSAEWSHRLAERNAFITSVLVQPKIWLIGDQNDISS